MNSWPFVKLGSLAKFKNGLNYSKENWGKGVKVVGVSDFQDYLYPRYEELEEINPNGVVRDVDYLEEGDVVFVRSNGNRMLIGRSLFIKDLPERISHSGFTIRLRFTSSKVHIPFYVYLFRTPLIRTSLSVAGGGTNINNLNQQILSKLDVPLPPIETQRKIAAILSAYDELIENSNRRIALLEKMAEEIYREWFVRMRFPGHEKVKFEKGLPEGWEVRTIGDLCVKVTDGSHSSPEFFPDGKYMASVKDMNAYGFSLGSMKRISEQDFERLMKADCKPRKNDVLIAKDGSYLKHVFVWDHEYEVVILSSIAMLRPNLDKILPYFLSLVLKQESTKTMMSGYVSGSALPRIILNDFKKMKLLIPKFDLIEKFESIVEPVYKSIIVLNVQVEKLEIVRDRLLPRLISGKLSVENLDIRFPPGMMDEG